MAAHRGRSGGLLRAQSPLPSPHHRHRRRHPRRHHRLRHASSGPARRVLLLSRAPARPGAPSGRIEVSQRTSFDVFIIGTSSSKRVGSLHCVPSVPEARLIQKDATRTMANKSP